MTNPNPKYDRSALRWVRGELNETLRTARRALEAYAEGDADPARLDSCREHLHQAEGTLQMVEMYGAAMLAGELEQVVEALAGGKLRAPESAAENLMLGIVQLPVYLERIASGEPDIPLMLLPLMNDLRAARAAPLVSAVALFAPKLGQLLAAEPIVPGSGNPALPEEIRRRRGHYQRALVAWLRSSGTAQGLRDLRDILDLLAARAGTARLRRLLDTAAALLTVSLEGPAESDSAVRPLYGQLDRFLKRVMDVGEEAAVADFPLELLRSLMYYAARSDSQNPVVLAVRQAADLANSFERVEAVGGAEPALGGTDQELFQAVSEALRQDLRGIKDELDLYIRGSRDDRGRLTALAEPLQRVGDTLGMIGRGGLRSRLKARADQIRAAGASAAAPDDDLLMGVAGDILHVESALAGLDQTEEAAAASDSAVGQSGLSAAEMQDHVTAAVNETFADLAKVKEAISEYLRAPQETAYLTQVPARLHAVAGALRVLEQPDVAALLDGLAPYLNAVIAGDCAAPGVVERDALADVITGAEYFLEAVLEDRPNRDEIVGYASAAAARLGLSSSEAASGGFSPEAAPPDAGGRAAATADEAPTTAPELGEQPAPGPVPAAGDALAASAPVAEIDDEILEIFLEEAREELAVVQEQYPRWRHDAGDLAALQTLRRSFHTLKGSGRLVGAKLIGEFAWSVENLLNRVIEGTVAPGAELLALMDDACGLLAQLVEAQAGGAAPATGAVDAVAARAFGLAKSAVPAPLEVPGVPEAAAPAEVPEVVATAAAVEAQEWAEAPAAAAAELTEAPEPVDAPEMVAEALETAAAVETPEPIEAPDWAETSVPAEAPAWVSAAEAAETPALPEIAERAATPEGSAAHESIATADSAAAPGPAEDLAFPDGTEIGAAPAPVAVAADESVMPFVLDPVLYDIFRNEADAHLSVLDGFLQRYGQDAAGGVYEPALHRALHTLHGSANMAGVRPIAELAGAFETFVNLSMQLGAQAAGTDLALLGQGAVQFRDLLAAINQPGARVPEWQALQRQVLELAEALQEEINAAEALSEPLTEPLSEQITELVSEPRAAVRATPIELDLDPELLEIFLEEARELVERMDGEFQAWEREPGAPAHVADLQRTLHTLKGGARLAGVLPLGDLSHALESLFAKVHEGDVQASGKLRAVARRGVDQLATALEVVQAEGIVPDTSEMVERIEAAARGDFVVAESILLDYDEAGGGTGGRAADSADTHVEETLETESETGEPELAGMPEPEDSLLTDSQLFPDSELVGQSASVSNAPAGAPQPAGDAGQVIPFPLPQRTPAAGLEAVAGRSLRQPPPEEPPAAAQPTQERVRVHADLLDQMVNNAGEVSIFRSRLEQQNNTLGFNLVELEQTITRLREQLRQLELETEAQILSRHEDDRYADFDPLELDRYSNIQELSRALSETVSDLGSIGTTLDDLRRDTDTLLLQHARVSNELQDGLLRTRMVPFASRVSRLQRVVRQTAQSLGKQAELVAPGAQGEMDRSILERMMAPLEHLLRNAVAHGIESPAARLESGKPETGRIVLEMSRDGSDVVITVSDDGAGLDRAAIRRKAIARQLLDPNAEVEDAVLDQYILEPGFSTAAQVTQIAGRGVGMDVVISEVKLLGGTLQLESEPGKGVRFSIRLPFTLAITDGLLVQQGEDTFAVPHGSVDGVLRVSRQDLEECYTGRRDGIHYLGKTYQVRYLGSMLGDTAPLLAEAQRWYPMLLVRSGEHRVAVQVDALLGNRQIVVKSVGVQLATVRWFSGATILSDGRVAMILDMSSLVRAAMAQKAAPAVEPISTGSPAGITVMVVDDSITVRKVTGRLLERHAMQVITAKDGVDAVALLQENRPDVMLLDIEMPRMDGFELARHMQNTAELSDIPIIMITSRTGEKHRMRALSLGVKRYLGKPYQEAELLDNIYTVLAEQTA